MIILGVALATWIFIAIILISLILEYKNETEASAFLLLLGSIFGVYFEWYTVSALLIYALAYLIVGSIWAWVRWGRHCRRSVEYHKEVLKSGGALRVSGSWVDHVDPNEKEKVKNALKNAVDVSKYHTKLLSWAVNWPLSIFANLTGDLLDAYKKVIVRYYTKILQSASDKALKDFDNVD